MTFEQIKLCAKCIYKHKIDMITMVMEPIGAAFGSKKAKQSLAKRTKKSTPKTKEERAKSEEMKLRQLQSLGIDIS